MANEIISYIEMCQREGISLQRGMNFKLSNGHSVILMSVRQGAPYEDKYEDDGATIIYEGHDVPKSSTVPNPKAVNQPKSYSSGILTENGKFFQAAENYKIGSYPPTRVCVYEKIKSGIWSYNGIFHLVDSWEEYQDTRMVLKFKLVAVEGEEDLTKPIPVNPKPRRVIPTHVKIAVWKRDNGKCVKCGSSNDLHFDHIIPWSKGGSSSTVENIQLLCSQHNLEKHDKIE